MAHVFDVSLYATGSSNPLTMSFTPSNGATLLVLGINVSGANNRTNYSTAPPTFGGIQMKLVNVVQKAASSPEVVSELWYHLNPSTGSAYTISVPNAATSRTLYLRASTFKAQSTYSTIFNASVGGNGTSANPTLTVSASTGGVIVGCFGDGLATLPSVYDGIPILPVDHGAFTSVDTYKILGADGNASLGYTIDSDDWGLVIGSWSEQAPPRIYGGILKEYNGSSWVECPSSKMSFYNGASWTVCPSTKFKVYRDSAWYQVRRNGGTIPSSLLTGLLGYWKLDESSGNASDSVGSTTGVSTDITYTATGKISRCFTFNNSSSQLLLGNATAIKPTSAISISFWMKTATAPAVEAMIIDCLSENNGYRISLYLDGGFGFIFGNGTSILDAYVGSGSFGNLYDDAWRHIVLTFDGTTAKCYFNNTNNPAEDETWNNVISHDTADIYIGSNSSNSRHYEGTLDEIGIWNRALTADEVSTLYNAGAGKTHPFN
jgi:hypothetical protein